MGVWRPMKFRTGRTALLAWLPVVCLVTLSFSTAPVSSEPRQAGNLTISPKEFYGGQGVTFKGTLGSGGAQTIWLEFHMGRAGDTWTRIEGSTEQTKADGSFEFVFPARGMNNIKLRVAAQGTATPPVNFTAHDQVAALAIQPADLDYGDSRCGGGFNEHIRYYAVSTEDFTLTVDTTPRNEPVLTGRKVFLERRTGGNQWDQVGTDNLSNTGKATFNLTATGTDAVAYRARLDEWTKDGSRIGWYPSFPTYVDPQRRPDPVTGLADADPDPGDDPTYVYPEAVAVSWTPVGGAADDVVIAWKQGNNPPDRPDQADDVVIRQPDAGRFELDGLQPETKYSFALFARSSAGICSHPVTRTLTTDPIPVPPAVTNVTAAATSPTWPTAVQLQWDQPQGQALERLHIYVDGMYVTELGPEATGYTVPDWYLTPGATHTFEIYTENRWGERSDSSFSNPVNIPAVTP